MLFVVMRLHTEKPATFGILQKRPLFIFFFLLFSELVLVTTTQITFDICIKIILCSQMEYSRVFSIIPIACFHITTYPYIKISETFFRVSMHFHLSLLDLIKCVLLIFMKSYCSIQGFPSWKQTVCGFLCAKCCHLKILTVETITFWLLL